MRKSSEAWLLRGEVMLDQFDKILQWNDWTSRWVESKGYCLHDFGKVFDTVSSKILEDKLFHVWAEQAGSEVNWKLAEEPGSESGD